MQREGFVLKFSETRRRFLIIACLAATLCFCQSIAAQSGRRTDKTAAPSKTPSAAEPAVDPPKTKPDAEISSIVVFGQRRDKSYFFSTSNYLDIALKECVNDLKDRPQASRINVAKGGKMNFAEAVERAKKETDVHVLWIELVMGDDAYGNTTVDYIDYAVLAPQTAKRLTYGRVEPGRPDLIVQGGVPRVPSVRKRLGSPTSQIRTGAREIVNRLIRWDWL